MLRVGSLPDLGFHVRRIGVNDWVARGFLSSSAKSSLSSSCFLEVFHCVVDVRSGILFLVCYAQ